MSRTEAFTALQQWCAHEPSIRAAILLGSSARDEADDWSDIDLQLICDHPARLLTPEKLQQHFPLWAHSQQETYGKVPKHSLVLEGGLDIELIPIPTRDFKLLLWTLGKPWLLRRLPQALRDTIQSFITVHARGSRVFYDARQYCKHLARIHQHPGQHPLTPADCYRIAQHFYYHAQWILKKWQRGEHLAGTRELHRQCLEDYTRLIREITHRDHPDRLTWHEQRRIEQWAAPQWLTPLQLSANAPLAQALKSLLPAFSQALQHLDFNPPPTLQSLHTHILSQLPPPQ